MKKTKDKIRLRGKSFLFIIIRTINGLFKSDKKSIYFIPHSNTAIDGYDIINYESDNVLCLINYMLFDDKFQDYVFYVEVYDSTKISIYQKYLNKHNRKNKIIFLFPGLGRSPICTKIKNYICFFKSAYCFFADYHLDLRFKLKLQKTICLGYYTPFKNDFVQVADVYEYEKQLHNSSVDFHITTSKLASRIIAVDSGISYYKFLELGFPRNDIFFSDRKKIIRQDILNEINEKYNSVENIILYTPTFRDYELKENTVLSRDLFGFKVEDMQLLCDLLKRLQAVIIVKLHPWQLKVFSQMKLPSRVILERNPMSHSLYKYLSVADVLITDYTSTYFDFLLSDKPVIFNFYDFDKYQTDRGFSYEPIEPFCAGEIVYNYTDFLSALYESLSSNDKNKHKRDIINKIMNKDMDGYSTKRISSYFFE